MKKLEAIQKILGSKIRALKNDIAILSLPEEVTQAIQLAKGNIDLNLEKLSPALLWDEIKKKPSPTSEQLFRNKSGEKYPCWLPGDETLGDDWLLSPEYYPFYFRIYAELGSVFQNPTLLEFGVRSGYSGLVFSKAVQKPCRYFGVDPNLYVAKGLESAASTYAELRSEGFDLTSFLLEGFSSSEAVQKTLSFSEPFEFIHVDGEHTLAGKIYDLWIARNLVSKEGFVLVDDFEHHGFINQSVKVACKLGWFSKVSYVPTKRGLAVLKM